MFRQWIIILNLITFIFTQQTWALTTDEIKGINQVFQSLELRGSPFTLKQLVERARGKIHPQQHREFMQMIQPFANEKIDRADIKKIMVQGQQQVVVTLYQGRNYMSLTIENTAARFASISGRFDGKDYAVNLRAQDLMGSIDNLARVLTKQTGTVELKLLSLDGVQRLSPQERVKYFSSLQKLMVTVEKLQNFSPVQKRQPASEQNVPKPGNNSSKSDWQFLQQLIGDEAQAAGETSLEDQLKANRARGQQLESEIRQKNYDDEAHKDATRGAGPQWYREACVCAAYPTQKNKFAWGRGCCEYLAEDPKVKLFRENPKTGAKEVCCNPDIYDPSGTNPVCVDAQEVVSKLWGSKKYIVPDNATEQCTDKVAKEPGLYLTPQQFKLSAENAKEWDTKNEELMKNIKQRADEICAKMSSVDLGADKARQKSTCEALKRQVEQVNFSCEQLAKKNLAENTVCKGTTVAVEAPQGTQAAPLAAAMLLGGGEAAPGARGTGQGGATGGGSGPGGGSQDTAGGAAAPLPVPTGGSLPQVTTVPPPPPSPSPTPASPTARAPEAAPSTARNGEGRPPAAKVEETKILKGSCAQYQSLYEHRKLINCTYGSEKSITCQDGEESMDIKYCECKSADHNIDPVGGRAIQCREQTHAQESEGGGKKSKGFFDGFFKGSGPLLLAAGVIGIGAWAFMNWKDDLNKQTDQTLANAQPPVGTSTGACVKSAANYYCGSAPMSNSQIYRAAPGAVGTGSGSSSGSSSGAPGQR